MRNPSDNEVELFVQNQYEVNFEAVKVACLKLECDFYLELYETAYLYDL